MYSYTYVLSVNPTWSIFRFSAEWRYAATDY